MYLYNSLTHKKELFKPNSPDVVKMYTCGPTVYHYAHIGNLRTYIMEDVLEKALRYTGYNVKRVMNITDVGHLASDADTGEDKMLKGAKRENKSVMQIAQYYTDAFFADCEKLNIKRPEVVEPATNCIAEYIEMVQKLLDNGKAYFAGGNVYFDTSMLGQYYVFNDHDEEDLAVGVREGVEEDTNKKNRNDFVLWFTKSKFEDQALKWDSPWGVGYPGWHIECSCISMKHLGGDLDIHCGGIDNAFPHHTNEIAQSESYLGHKWCNYWFHVHHLNTDDGKMSKSKGEFLTVSLLESKGYDPMAYRLFCLQSHYRRNLVFSWENLDNAVIAYNKLIARIAALKNDGEIEQDAFAQLKERFVNALYGDLNTSVAVTAMYDVLKAKTNDATKLAALADFDQVLCLNLLSAAEKLRQKQQEEAEQSADPEIDALVAARTAAKKEKNFAEADRIRDELKAKGIEIIDTPPGYEVEKSMKLLILDGNSVINRAYYGVKPLTTRDGLYTNAIYGFLNILEKMEKEEQPEAVCVAFDLHGPTFRHEKYDGYKANRHGMDEELAMQMPVMKQVLQAMNIPIYECQGWEADDIIGTVGKICSNHEWECVIVTGDRDSLQLIDENVHVKLVISKPGQTTATLYDIEKFQEEYGFEPKKMVDLKSLMGDNSDNIPGVAGVGPKTATDLLLKFGSLDGVYANLDDPSIRPKLREKLEIGKENAYLSYDLATIQLTAPIDFEPKDALIQPYNKAELYKLFQRLEFVRLIDKYNLRDAAPVVSPCACKGVKLPVKDVLPGSCCSYAIYIAPDSSVGIAWQDGVCALTPMESMFLNGFLQQDCDVICHDIKSTCHQLQEMGIAVPEFAFDTALAAYDLNPSQSDYPISKLATTFLGVTVDDGDAAACAEALWNLRSVLEQQLTETEMLSLYREIELPLCKVLFDMEQAGVAIDKNQLEQFGTMLSQRISDCEKLIFEYSDEPFNINSSKQLGELLFEKLGLPVMKKTKTGYSTNADVLEKLKNKHPIIPAIMDYRTLTKLKSTYADGLMKVICEDGRIRTTFQNLVTATGRLSSTEPNLQNIPVRNDLGAEIRKMFIPKPGCVLVDADYSQIELRVLAHIADDKTMQDAFISGMDIHTVTASQVFGVPAEQVTAIQRRHAKAVNFGIVYGISEFSLSEDIGVTRYEAKDYIDSYLEKYSGVRLYMKKVVEDARKTGYTKTLYGRRRYIPELSSSNFNIRQGAERVALNTPIQGTAADLIKLAMIRVYYALKENYPQARLLLQVHDELIVECPEEDAANVAQLISKEMEQVAALRVPLVAEAKWGKSWYEAK